MVGMNVRIGIIGTGAVGGYYGGLLAQAGNDVHFLSRSDAAVMRSRGLTVRSKHGDFHIDRVQAYGSVDEMPTCDLVIVALKTTENHHLAKLLPPVVGQRGLVLALQNGLTPEADSAAIVGNDRVLGGCCFLCCQKAAPGVIEHLDYGLITMGEYQPVDAAPLGETDRLRQIGELLKHAGIPVSLSGDLWHARWSKLVWNVPFNGLSVALQTSTDQLMRRAEPLVRSLMEEVVAAARSCGRDLGDATIEKMLENTRRMVPYESSMSLDFKAGRPLEIEAIYGAPIRFAAERGTCTPRMEMLWQQLQFLQAHVDDKSRIPVNSGTLQP